MRSVNRVFDTGAGPILLREDTVEPDWMSSIGVSETPRRRSATNEEKLIRQKNNVPQTHGRNKRTRRVQGVQKLGSHHPPWNIFHPQVGKRNHPRREDDSPI